MYLVRVGHLHRGDGVACIHRTLKRVLIHHSQDIRKRRTVHEGGSTRHEVLSVVGRGGKDVCVVLGDLSNDSGDVFGQRVDQSIVLSHKHLSDTRNTGSVLGNSVKALAKNQHGNLDKVGLQ